MSSHTYTTEIYWDEDVWVAIADLPNGARTHVETPRLNAVADYTAAAISDMLDATVTADQIDLVYTSDVATVLARLTDARNAATAAAAELSKVTGRTARDLVALGMTRVDAARVMDLSKQRMSQLLNAKALAGEPQRVTGKTVRNRAGKTAVRTPASGRVIVQSKTNAKPIKAKAKAKTVRNAPAPAVDEDLRLRA